MIKTSTHALSALLVTSFVGCSGPTTVHGGATSLAPTSAPAKVPLRVRNEVTKPGAQPSLTLDFGQQVYTFDAVKK